MHILDRFKKDICTNCCPENNSSLPFLYVCSIRAVTVFSQSMSLLSQQLSLVLHHTLEMDKVRGPREQSQRAEAMIGPNDDNGSTEDEPFDSLRCPETAAKSRLDESQCSPVPSSSPSPQAPKSRMMVSMHNHHGNKGCFDDLPVFYNDSDTDTTDSEGSDDLPSRMCQNACCSAYQRVTQRRCLAGTAHHCLSFTTADYQHRRLAGS